MSLQGTEVEKIDHEIDNQLLMSVSSPLFLEKAAIMRRIRPKVTRGSHLARMNSHVSLEIRFAGEPFQASFTRKFLLTGMNWYVSSEMRSTGES